MWENFTTSLGTQIFAGWTAPKSIWPSISCQRVASTRCCRGGTRASNRSCFHKWGEHLSNFQLLLLSVDLFSFYSTKIKQRCLFQTLDIIAQSINCFLPVIHWMTIMKPKTWLPALHSVIPVDIPTVWDAAWKWPLPFGHTAVKASGNLPWGFEWGAGLVQQINTNIPQPWQRGHRGGVGQAGTLVGLLLVLAALLILGKLFLISVLSPQSGDTDISLLWKAVWLTAVAKK